MIVVYGVNEPWEPTTEAEYEALLAAHVAKIREVMGPDVEVYVARSWTWVDPS